MKKSELDLSLLKNCFETLKECYSDYTNQSDEKLRIYIKDSCIKRFEYTYETAKKIMNKYLKKEYDKSEKDLSINNIFREMFALGLIKDFENWAEYREKRNTTAHEYDIKKTYPIIEIIPKFIDDVDFFITNIEKVLTND